MKNYSLKKRTLNKRKRETKRYRKEKREKKYKGGSKSPIISPEPYQEYGLPKGATNYREAAILQQQQMNEFQNHLNNMHGGSNSNTKLVVPSFANSGDDISPYNSNTSSQLNNATHLQAKVDATNDHWAFTPEITGGKSRTKSKSKSKTKSKSHKVKGKRTKKEKKNKRDKRKTKKRKTKYLKQKGGYLNWYEAFPDLYNTRNTG